MRSDDFMFMVLRSWLRDGLMEISVDEDGEFIFYCTESQKLALEKMLE